MALHEPVHHGSKSLREGAVCFACALAVLTAAAVVLKFAMGFLG